MSTTTKPARFDLGGSPRPILLLLGSQGDHWGSIVNPWIFEYFPSAIYFDSMGSTPQAIGTILSMQSMHVDAIGYLLGDGPSGVTEISLGYELGRRRQRMHPFSRWPDLFISVHEDSAQAGRLRDMVCSLFDAVGLTPPCIGESVDDFKNQIRDASVKFHTTNRG